MTAGWREVALGDICTVRSGSSNTQDAVVGGPYVFFDRSKTSKRSNRYLFDCEALIIAGEGAEFRPKRYTGKFDLHQRAYAIYGFGDQLIGDYLFYYLEHVHEYFQQVAVGATVKSLRQRHFDDLPVLLPPVEEQRRIVAVLDEAFAAIATAIANTEKNLANARGLLLNEIDRELSRGGPDWTATNLDSVCSRFKYGTSAKSKSVGNVPVLRMGNIQDGDVDWSDLVFSDDESDIDQLTLKPNDVLFNRTNSLEHVGKSAIVRGERQAIFAGYLIRVDPIVDVLDPEFLNLYLNSRPVRSHGRALAGKSVNQANISAGKLRTYPIRLPPLGEQKEIVAKIARMRTYAEALKGNYLAKRAALIALNRSLLARAFAGNLNTAKPETSVAIANDNFASPQFTAQVIAYAYHRHERQQFQRTFGHVKAQKALQLAESVGGLDLGRRPIKDAAGPNDFQHMLRATDWAVRNGFFEFVPRASGNGYDFKKLGNFGPMMTEALAATRPQAAALERAIDPIVPMISQDAEVFATVHAAWNNLLHDAKVASDDAIVKEAREDWHSAKLKIPEAKFRTAIQSLRARGLVPDGTAKYVGGQGGLF